MTHVLLVDDDPGMLNMMREALGSRGFQLEACKSAEEALPHLQTKSFDLMITDVKLPGKDGLALLAESKKIQTDLPVIVITAFGGVEMAVRAMQEGAVDFMAKPFPLVELDVKVEKALEGARKQAQSSYLQEEISHIFGKFVGETSTMQDIFSLIQKAAPTKSTVLIRGESGTGKELVARAIHELSPWKNEAFIKVNCAALAPGVLESELFGHEKGAFTSADARRRGRFELAHKGTLFLDEIGDMPENLQSKLLRVIQDKEFERVGSEESIRVDVRLVAATHQDLEKLIQSGKFRQDLFYRLNVIAMVLPPLRERLKDIPALVDTFIQIANHTTNKKIKGASKAALEKLMGYAWPGNGRELQNVVERAVVLSEMDMLEPDVVILDAGVPSGTRTEDIPGNLTEQMETYERSRILDALNATDWVQVKAAHFLGITRTALQYKMKKYELQAPPRVQNG